MNLSQLARELGKQGYQAQTPARGAMLIEGDALDVLARLPSAAFDLAIADPPYGASGSGAWSIRTGHSLPGMGGQWKAAAHDWDRTGGMEALEFSAEWLRELKRLVRPTGSIWLHATYHNAGILNVACQLVGLEIINEVVWFKRNAFPNLSGRRLTASHETLLWVHTGGKQREYHFNYEVSKGGDWSGDSLKRPGKQMRTVWDIPNNKSRDELADGKHPTQKPLRLTSRLLELTGQQGGSLLVPFLGSGTEIVAGLRFGMDCVGIESDSDWVSLAKRRIDRCTEMASLLQP